VRVAVIGASGQVGSMVVTALERDRHDVVSISRSTGVDVESGIGLTEALEGVEVVVDVINNRSQEEAEIIAFFGAATRNLLAAEQRANVRHHVLLSVVGLDNGQRVPHYSGKREQERLVTGGPIPWSIVRATQFHELAARAASLAVQNGVATIAPLLVQPIAPADVADTLAEVATGEPLLAKMDLAGPETHDFVDMAQRTFAARGHQIKLVPTWRGMFDTSMAGEVLLPGPDARIGSTTFDDWLAAGAR
jgi:uncharacterized protein YbjT (DUF2867 family)